MSAQGVPTIEELAPDWHRILAPAIAGAGVPYQDVDDVASDFLVYAIEHDLLGRYDPERMPLDAYLRGYVRKYAQRARQSAVGFGYELVLDDPETIEPGKDDPNVESLGDLDDFRRFADWLAASDARRDHADLLRAWIVEVYGRDRVNRYRIALRLGWTPFRVNREMPQLREAGKHFGI